MRRSLREKLSLTKQKAIRPNGIKAKVDNMQRNSKCEFCGDRDETINYIISEWRKLAPKKGKRQDTTVWGRWSTRICLRNWNLTIPTNGICITSNPSWRMRRTRFWYTNGSPNRMQTTRPGDNQQKTENLLNNRLCRFDRPKSKIKESEKR